MLRVQECCSSFCHSVSVATLLHMHTPPPPAKSFLCFLIEKVYFAVSAICVGDTAVLEGQ